MAASGVNVNQQGASYIIGKDDTTYYAIKASTGQVEFSGAVAPYRDTGFVERSAHARNGWSASGKALHESEVEGRRLSQATMITLEGEATRVAGYPQSWLTGTQTEVFTTNASASKVTMKHLGIRGVVGTTTYGIKLLGGGQCSLEGVSCLQMWDRHIHERIRVE